MLIPQALNRDCTFQSVCMTNTLFSDSIFLNVRYTHTHIITIKIKLEYLFKMNNFKQAVIKQEFHTYCIL